MSRRKTEKRSHSASAKMRDEALLSSSSYSAQLHLLQRAERPHSVLLLQFTKVISTLDSPPFTRVFQGKLMPFAS